MLRSFQNKLFYCVATILSCIVSVLGVLIIYRFDRLHKSLIGMRDNNKQSKNYNQSKIIIFAKHAEREKTQESSWDAPIIRKHANNVLREVIKDQLNIENEI